MNFRQRVPFFAFGLLIGIIITFFILQKKDTSFDYMPNARVLKNIRIKERVYTDNFSAKMLAYQIDTAVISKILLKGNVDIFNKVKLDSCTQYTITEKVEGRKFKVVLKNCKNSTIFDELDLIE